ncbi:hypothetical protein [Mucilaginibacter sp. OK098]|uniref:hypothetical protein n=1 Tax=Mucilaginibacter sp. OK098 TaxID=1855297 RepID=UPI000915278C|nr:hypothetical protein [Mucilaginibacter sp. OK098]SHM75754.1 hypothetical protein SAMN05216524_103305 [Mucilaginibacter sp. OK098]
MLLNEFEQLLDHNKATDWMIAPGLYVPESLNNKDYIVFKCKTCGSIKRHSVGNVKYSLLNDPYHCRCQICRLKINQELTSLRLLKKAEAAMAESAGFPWYLDGSKINHDVFYNVKTPLPLLCKTCNNLKMHSFSNVLTAIKKPGHIICQPCSENQRLKLKLEKWRQKVNLITCNEYDLDTSITASGYKVIHLLCGKFYYIRVPNSLKKGLCPFCKQTNTSIFQRLKDENQLITYIAQKTADQLKLHQVNKADKILVVSCNLHPKQGTYPLPWSSFVISHRKKGPMLCPLCNKQRLRRTTYEQYNRQLEKIQLRIEMPAEKEKIDTKEKVLHWCTARQGHPAFYASPYQVLSKNKRCLFCYDKVSFHKNYDFIKIYTEMDDDRFFTHAGKKFRLLSSKAEIESQIKPFQHIGQVSIRLNELTCHLHNEYNVTWGNFYYNNAACAKCTRENNVSYAHSYYQALLAYFNFNYIPEFPIKINSKTTYRIDFKLSTQPNYLEIDSSLHVNKGWDRDQKMIRAYTERDRIKDSKLGGNIERIKLYNNKNQHLPLKTQIQIIETAFLNRALQNNIPIMATDIQTAKRDPVFFRNARIVNYIRKLEYYHQGHIEFKNKTHLSVLNALETNESEFFCKIHQQAFVRNLYSVAKLDFLCPICRNKIILGQQKDYYLSQDKIQQISEFVDVRFDGDFAIDTDRWAQDVHFFQTIVFPAQWHSEKRTVFISIRELISLPVEDVYKRLKKTKYISPYIKHKRYFNSYCPVEINSIEFTERLNANKNSEIMLSSYQHEAKLINRLMKKSNKGGYIEQLIDNNEKKALPYTHKTADNAKLCLATFDRKIIPFFADLSDIELLTPRKNYAYNKQYLLLRDLRCGHRFYCSWNWITVRKKMNKGIQCQHKDCFDVYYKQAYRPGNKMADKKILEYFRNLFNAQYYPVYPDQIIKIREPIEVSHLPTGRKFKTSVDNFRRGKFRCIFKKLSSMELSQLFPLQTTNNIR